MRAVMHRSAMPSSSRSARPQPLSATRQLPHLPSGHLAGRCSSTHAVLMAQSQRSQRLQRRRRWRQIGSTAAAAAAAPAVAAAGVAAPAAAAAVLTNTGSVLVGIGVCIMAAAFSALVFFTIPTMLAWRRTAIALERLARVTAEEVPDTAAAMRLSGMEVTDAVEELSLLGADLTRGVRASAASVIAAEAAVRNGAAAARGVVESRLLPAARRGAPAVRDALEGTVQRRAGMSHTGPAIAGAASAAKHAAQQTRAAIGAADLAGRAAALTALLRRRAAQGGPNPEPEQARAGLTRQAPPQGGAALTAGD